MMLNAYIVNSQHEKLSRLLGGTRMVIDSLMRTSHNGVAILDEEGNFVCVNIRLMDMFGIHNDVHQVDVNIFDVFGSIFDSEKAALISGDTICLDTNSRESDVWATSEEVKYFRISVSPMLDGGVISGYFAIIMDITDITQTEHTLRFKNEQLDRLHKYVEHIFLESKVVLWRFFYDDISNSKLEAELLFGQVDIKKGDKIDFEDFIKVISPKEAETFLSNIRTLLECEVGGRIITNDHQITNPKTGEVFYHRCTMSSVLNSDGSKEVLCAVSSITDLVNQKKELEIANFKSRLLIDGGGMEPWEFDVIALECGLMESDSEKYNDQISKIDKYLSIVCEEYKDRVIQNINILHSGENVTREYEYCCIPKGVTEPIYIKTYYTPFSIDENGKVTRYIGYNRNVTETHRLIGALGEALEKAENADKLKTQFLANMSHEIRTPLNAIVGFSEMLSYAKSEDEKSRYQKHIYSNTDMLLHLINDILDLSKIESGSMNIVRDVFDLSLHFDEIMASLKSRILDRDVEFICENPYPGLIVQTDKRLFAQLVSNYVTNAIKNTAFGYIKVGYELRENNIFIYVRDTGCGISEENISKLYNRFEKFDTHTQGTGLGLAINKAIVSRFGGECGCDSTFGKGSYFWATFPIEVVEVNERAFVESINVVSQEAFAGSLPRGLKFLVAEDNDSNFVLVSSILGEVEITRALNGRDAVLLLQENNYDMVLMDIRMPIMNGDEAIQLIRTYNKDIPIIALTSNAYESDKVAVMEAGANEYITKPIRRDHVLGTILKYLK